MSESLSTNEQSGNSKVKDSAQRAVSEMREGASKIGSAISNVSNETMHEASRAASDMYNVVRDKGREKAQALEHYVQQAPVTSLGAAFIGGLILGALFRRS